MDDILLELFIRGAVGGVSKTQLLRSFREDHDCSEEDLDFLVKSAFFKEKPKNIDHKKIYERPLKDRADRIWFPFTQLYFKDNFLSEDECQELIDFIEQGLRPSTVANETDDGEVSDYRTSSTTDLDPFANELSLRLDQKITAFMDLDPFVGETLQAQKYLPYQYYKEHVDFFFPFTEEHKVYCEWMGQRTWTVMIYLNDVESGGETYFKYLNKYFKPKQGTLLCWNNLYKNGIPNYKTMHEALPPVSGNKYVITKWFRSWPLI